MKVKSQAQRTGFIETLEAAIALQNCEAENDSTSHTMNFSSRRLST